jgi:hypothetical protein
MRYRLLAAVALVWATLAAPVEASHGGTYVVPSSIASDCSRAVDGEINNWLRTIPDHSVIQFGYQRCYAQNDTILLVDKNIMTVNGQGSTFRAVTQGHSHRANWRIRAGSNINVFNMRLVGSNANGGITDTAYVPSLEFQHGIAFESVAGGIVDNVHTTNTYGDGFLAQVDERIGPSARPVSHLRITNSSFAKTGRQGIALTHADTAHIENVTFTDINMNAVDLEPDVPEHLVRNVTVTRNTFSRTRFSNVAALGQSAAPNFTNIDITNNTQTADPVSCQGPVVVESPTSGRRTDWTITGNSFRTYSDGFYMVRSDDVLIDNNSVAHFFGGCGREAGVRLFDSDRVTVTNNRFTGASQAVVADAASSSLTVTGNTT